MMDLQKFITELDSYCEAMGWSHATVCGRATGNPRLAKRLRNRADQTEKDIKQLRKYMAENPPPEGV